MKLKTLKDFINEANIKGANKTHREVANLWYDILAHKLKTEAIKWRKLRREQSMNIAEEDWDAFFNITEEDLK